MNAAHIYIYIYIHEYHEYILSKKVTNFIYLNGSKCTKLKSPEA